MSQAVESVNENEMTLEEVAAHYRKPPPPPPRDPSYTFERKGPDQYPSKTLQDPEKGSNLTEAFTKERLTNMTFRPGEGQHSRATMRLSKRTASGEIDNSGLNSGSLQEKYGSVKK